MKVICNRGALLEALTVAGNVVNPRTPKPVLQCIKVTAGGHLKQLIAQTLFAAAKESTRYAFNGVLVVAKGKKIHLVSTDGRRLAQANGDLSNAGKLPKDGAKAIIPTKALQLVEKLIDDPEEAVGFQMRANQVSVHTQSATLTS